MYVNRSDVTRDAFPPITQYGGDDRHPQNVRLPGHRANGPGSLALTHLKYTGGANYG